jgi:hypothetical protein
MCVRERVYDREREEGEEEEGERRGGGRRARRGT